MCSQITVRYLQVKLISWILPPKKRPNFYKVLALNFKFKFTSYEDELQVLCYKLQLVNHELRVSQIYWIERKIPTTSKVPKSCYKLQVINYILQVMFYKLLVRLFLLNYPSKKKCQKHSFNLFIVYSVKRVLFGKAEW